MTRGGRKPLPDLDAEKNKRGLKLALKLALLAKEAPDLFGENEIHRLVSRFQKHYGYSRDLKILALQQYLQKQGGTASIHELAENFHWHIDTVKNLVGEMEQKGLIKFYSGTPAGLGPGRPSRRIQLLNGNTRPPKN